MTSLTITAKDITTKSAKLITALQTAKSLEAELQAFYAHLQTEMEQHGIQSIKGDWGSLTLATRKVWTAADLPPRFYKQTLDTAKLNFLYKSGDTLPNGATYRETPYLSKRIK